MVCLQKYINYFQDQTNGSYITQKQSLGGVLSKSCVQKQPIILLIKYSLIVASLQFFSNFSEHVICRTLASGYFYTLVIKHFKVSACAGVSFLKKLQARGRKKKLWHCFPMNFEKFLRTPFLQNTSGRLLLFNPIKPSVHKMFFKYVIKMARFLGCSIILGTLGLLGLKSYEYLSETFVVFNETL